MRFSGLRSDPPNMETHLNTELFREYGTLGVGAGNEDTSIREEDGLGVVQPCNDCAIEDGHSLMAREGRIVQNGGEVRIIRQAKSSDSMVSTIQNHISTVWKCNHACENAL